MIDRGSILSESGVILIEFYGYTSGIIELPPMSGISDLTEMVHFETKVKPVYRLSPLFYGIRNHLFASSRIKLFYFYVFNINKNYQHRIILVM